jgi:hypothetical protein
MIADRTARTARLAMAPTWLTQVLNALRGLPQQPESTGALLARADAYESTQPSYAADLRAAVQRAARNG